VIVYGNPVPVSSPVSSAWLDLLHCASIELSENGLFQAERHRFLVLRPAQFIRLVLV
jgi:hypothetical protein